MTTVTPPSPRLSIAPGDAVLGLGGCLDYETVWDASVLRALAAHHGITAADLDHGAVLETERDLVRSILAFVRDGAGGERAVADHEVIEAFAARHQRRTTLGGSSVRAALAMSAVGVPSTLHLVSENTAVRDLLPADVPFICSGEGDQINPHLIVQFPEGAVIELADGTTVTAPRPNRLIYVADPPNRDMLLSPELGDLLSTARVFFISGFNAMTDQPALVQRMRDLVAAMQRLPADARVVFEDAGYHVPGFSRVVLDALGERVDVHGMNEDELQAYVGRPVHLLDPVDVAGALRAVRRVVHATTLVVHTRHWALALHAADEPAAPMRSALEGGIDMASARYLHGDGVDQTLFAAVRRLPRQSRGVEFARRMEALMGEQVAVVAARELVTPSPTTIGLGDSFVGGMLAAMVREGAWHATSE